MAAPSADRQSVFLNVPFDHRYEPLFITLVVVLTCLGLKPRCVLEIRETGQGRLARIFELLRSCGSSVHDLSRTGPPARFNMPFELGLACGLQLSGSPHEIIVLDSIPRRLDKTLSDYKGRDPLIHHNRCDDIVSRALDVFQVAGAPSPAELRSSARLLRRSARVIREEYETADIYRPAPFHSLVEAASRLAVENGFISR